MEKDVDTEATMAGITVCYSVGSAPVYFDNMLYEGFVADVGIMSASADIP